MPYRVLLLASLCLLLGSCLRMNKPPTMDKRCTQSLERARQLFAANTTTMDPATIALAQHLIKAARIDRQQHALVSCLERSSRAISLLTPPATTGATTADH